MLRLPAFLFHKRQPIWLKHLNRLLLKGEPSMRNRPSPYPNLPIKRLYIRPPIKSHVTSWEINSIPAPSSMPKAGIAARTVNGVRSPDIITQLSPCIPYYRPKNVFIRHYTIASRESNASDWLPAANVYRTEKSGNWQKPSAISNRRATSNAVLPWVFWTKNS